MSRGRRKGVVPPSGRAPRIRWAARPDSPSADTLTPDPDPLRAAVEALRCRFVTSGPALRADGVRRVAELGDGQVGDLHREADPAATTALLTMSQT
ncbi:MULTISPECIES: ATP-grasp domain-containing protein [unclassified Streptomyces]|uniref:ATP-grasp domain-containing protein n=1 Tax=unclassified Streptomyces TaxID=2593676 RepID=UPI002E37616A|nr:MULTISPECIES: ATP-grasp domain-containing protein [unclassified Streptomyces]WUC67724.1 ATP-grasp domain-containing protein [Streptomyces sp. NBC_00539]